MTGDEQQQQPSHGGGAASPARVRASVHHHHHHHHHHHQQQPAIWVRVAQIEDALDDARAAEGAAKIEAQGYGAMLRALLDVVSEQRAQQETAGHPRDLQQQAALDNAFAVIPQLGTTQQQQQAQQAAAAWARAVLPRPAGQQQQQQDVRRAHRCRRAAASGWCKLGGLAVGFLALFVLVVGMLATTTTTTTTTTGLGPVAFSDNGVVQAMAAVGRQVGLRAGLAMKAEEEAAYWRDQAYHERRGREAAEEEVSSLKAQLAIHRQELSEARQAYHGLELRYQSSEQQHLALKHSMSQERSDKERILSEREGLYADLALVGAERDRLVAELTHVQSGLAAAETNLAAEQAKTKELREALELQQAAAEQYRERVDVEVAARQRTQDLAVRVFHDWLDVQDRLTETRRALNGCQARRQQAEEHADRLSADKHYACVGWVSDLASRVRSAVLAPARGPDAEPFAATTASHLAYQKYYSKV